MDRWHLDLIVRQSRFSCRMCRWRGLASKGPHRFLVALTPARPRYDAGTGTTPLPALDLRGSPAADDPDGAQTITGTAFGMLPILPDSNSSGIKPGPIQLIWLAEHMSTTLVPASDGTSARARELWNI
ncbi:hypothetical protein [Kocuria carniphila]|uniref:hypothetical protein n=1 Tax=Kocuria carniphila TaxID=262208 RepID=UPI0028EAB2A8|nr:hypothetical protein [Kocuria carniphila]